ncbi:putative reverse transcriptase zinc-binding domain-containing protein [Helianthus anomalus]
MLTRNNNLQGNYVPSSCRWLPRKCSVFVWRLGLNKLATMDSLMKRNIVRGNQNCVFCLEAEETSVHLFTSCNLSSTVWSLVSLWCKIPFIWAFSVKDLLESHDFIGLSGKKKDMVQGIIRIGCWSIWKARNEVRFNNKNVKLEDIIRR